MSRNAGNVVLIGSRHSAGTLTLQEFLTRNNQPYAYLDVDRDASVQATLERFGVGVDDVPVFICRGKRVLKKPTIEEVAECLGFNRLQPGRRARPRRHRRRPRRTRGRGLRGVGGPGRARRRVDRARRAGRLELAHRELPRVSHGRLRAGPGEQRAPAGAEVRRRARRRADGGGARVRTPHASGRPRRRGVACRRERSSSRRACSTASPTFPNLARFEGVGVYYGATPVEALLCEGEDVIVVGGGNSAGQAAIFLSEGRRRVTMLVRGAGLSDTMSRYLVRRIEETPNIELRTTTQDRRPRRHRQPRAGDVEGRRREAHHGARSATSS